MTALRITLLGVAVAGAVLRPFRIPTWVVPLVCAVTAVAAGAISPTAARHAVAPLGDPIGFLLAAVPLSVLLDRLGFFAGLAELVTRAGRGTGGLWVLAALVTTVLNLDAAVVLLTPLYVRVARHTGRDPLTLAFQPILLAGLASSALPVSNLTNLIAVSWTSASTLGFVSHLALPSLAATIAGWWRYRRVSKPRQPAEMIGSDPHLAVDTGPDPSAQRRRALTSGGVVVALVLVGFVAGRSIGIQPWMVALGADLVLLVIMRRVPWSAIPWSTAILALSLGILAAAAVTHLGLHRLVGGTSTASLARTIAVSALGANVINNLPALLVALPALSHHPSPELWAVLLGVNMGPVLLVTGSLAGLLWLDTLHRLGVAVRPRDFTRIGVQVGLPAAAAGVATFLALNLIT